MLSRSGQSPRLVVALFLACGLAMLWLFAAGVVVGTVVEWLRPPTAYEDVLVRANEYVIHSYQAGARRGFDDKYRYPDGRPVPANEVEQWTSGTWPTAIQFVRSPRDKVDFIWRGWDYRLTSIWSRGRETAHWYFINDGEIDGHAYFVAYDNLTRGLVGYLGKDGFVQVRPPRERQFAIDVRRTVWGGRYGSAVVHAGGTSHSGFGPQSYEEVRLPPLTVYLLSGDELWLADLRGGTAKRLGQFPTALDLELAPLPPGAMDAPEKIEEKLMVRTPTEMIKLSLDGKELKHWPIPVEAQDEEAFQWYDTGGDRAVIRITRGFVSRNMEEALIWLAADGSVERRETVDLVQGGSNPGELAFLAVAMPMPTTLTFLFYKGASDRMVRGPDYSSALAAAYALFWPGLLSVYIVAAVLAVLAYRRQTRYGFSGAAAWAVFVFLLGVPGWLAYRWHREWPLLKECGDCHRAVPRDREACAACGQLFAAPPPLGTEIFG